MRLVRAAHVSRDQVPSPPRRVHAHLPVRGKVKLTTGASCSSHSGNVSEFNGMVDRRPFPEDSGPD